MCATHRPRGLLERMNGCAKAPPPWHHNGHVAIAPPPKQPASPVPTEPGPTPPKPACLLEGHGRVAAGIVGKQQREHAAVAAIQLLRDLQEGGGGWMDKQSVQVASLFKA